MSLSYSEIVTSFTIWEFLSELSKSFTQMDIYKVGIIDSRGKFLKNPEDYTSDKERRAGNAFYRLVVILKRALNTSADPLVRYAITNPMAALKSLSEEVENMGGNAEQFLNHTTPIVEEMSVGGGGIAGVGVPSSKPEEVVVPPSAATRHKKRVKKQSNVAGRKLFEQLLTEAKNRVVQTTGHMTHLGDYLYYGSPDLAIKHLEAAHKRFQGRTTPSHKMSLKADGGMSVVIKRHKDGTPAVAYKSGAAEYKTEDEIKAAGKEHLTRELIPALNLARRMNLKPGTAVQGDLLFTSGHKGTVQPNTITYRAPHGAQIGFAPHSGYSTDGLNLRKTTSHPDGGLGAEGAFIPDLAITKKTKLGITPERNKAVSSSIKQAKKILGDKKLRTFMSGLPGDKKFHRMMQEYSNEAARTTGVRTVKGLSEFIPTHMAKATQRKLSDKTKKAMTDAFQTKIKDNAHHFESMFAAHGHINAAKHQLLDQFAQHHDQFALVPHEGEHEGFVSSMGIPGKTESQAKFVREGPKGFPARNTENAIKRFGKAPEA